MLSASRESKSVFIKAGCTSFLGPLTWSRGVKALTSVSNAPRTCTWGLDDFDVRSSLLHDRIDNQILRLKYIIIIEKEWFITSKFRQEETTLKAWNSHSVLALFPSKKKKKDFY